MKWEDEYVLNGKNFNFILRRDRQKIPHERRDYESVDDNSLSLSLSISLSLSLGLCTKRARKEEFL